MADPIYFLISAQNIKICPQRSCDLSSFSSISAADIYFSFSKQLHQSLYQSENLSSLFNFHPYLSFQMVLQQVKGQEERAVAGTTLFSLLCGIALPRRYFLKSHISTEVILKTSE